MSSDMIAGELGRYGLQFPGEKACRSAELALAKFMERPDEDFQTASAGAWLLLTPTHQQSPCGSPAPVTISSPTNSATAPAEWPSEISKQQVKSEVDEIVMTGVLQNLTVNIVIKQIEARLLPTRPPGTLMPHKLIIKQYIDLERRHTFQVEASC